MNSDWMLTSLNTISDGVVVVDTQGIVRFCNRAAAALFGSPRDQLVGQTVPLPAFDQPLLLPFVHSSGEQLLLDITNAEITWENAPARLLTFRDVTAQTKLQAALNAERAALDAQHAAFVSHKDLNQMIIRFVSVISHEFRTPLATILLSADMIKSYGSRMTPERLLAASDSIQREVRKLDYMIEEILFTQRAERVRSAFHVEPMDVNQLVRDVVDEITRVATPTQSIEIVGLLDNGEAWLDERLMRRALMNLVLNATKYSSETSTITLTVDGDTETVTFQIQDYGIGIPDDDIPHIFELFYRGTNVRGYPGSGLGLPIVKQVVDLHGGEVEVQSSPEDGTVFTIRVRRMLEAEAMGEPMMRL